MRWKNEEIEKKKCMLQPRREQNFDLNLLPFSIGSWTLDWSNLKNTHAHMLWRNVKRNVYEDFVHIFSAMFSFSSHTFFQFSKWIFIPVDRTHIMHWISHHYIGAQYEHGRMERLTTSCLMSTFQIFCFLHRVSLICILHIRILRRFYLPNSTREKTKSECLVV